MAAKIDVPEDRIFAGFDAYQKAIAAGPDMVLLATPPGFRPIHYAAAIAAGKHVFMEKPCCVDAPGFRWLMETNKLADEKNLKVVVGLQRHHQASYVDGNQADPRRRALATSSCRGPTGTAAAIWFRRAQAGK